jgi:hypothetical protein
MRQYSIDHVELTWQGLEFKPGLAAGSTITEARTAPSWTIKAQANGAAIRVYSPDRTGTVSVLVNQEAALQQQLRALAQTDRLDRDIVGPMVLKDTSSGEQFTYKNAFIQTQPDEIRGTESSDFTWVFMFEDIEKTVSVDQNLVGS